MIGTGQQSQPFFCYFGSRLFSSLATNGRNGWKAVIKEAMLICIENFLGPIGVCMVQCLEVAANRLGGGGLAK